MQQKAKLWTKQDLQFIMQPSLKGDRSTEIAQNHSLRNNMRQNTVGLSLPANLRMQPKSKL